VYSTSKGPNKLIFVGIAQPVSDGIKLFLKETNFNFNSNKFLFHFFFVFLILFFWVLLVFNREEMLNYRVVIFILFYGVIGLGWSSYSKYVLLGAYCRVAQIISYGVSMIFIIIILFYFNKNFNLSSFFLISSRISLLIFGFWFLFLIWFVTILAELNRASFDFSGESELVSGFNVEYGREKFEIFLYSLNVYVFLFKIIIFFIRIFLLEFFLFYY